MDPKTLISDDLLNSPAVEHHGIKGMHWGVWNAETRRKYLGGIRKVAGAAASKVSKAAKAKAADVKTQHEAKAAEREEVRQQRKELGMTRKQYDKLRDTTIKSHDPRVVARGMKTLTDTELDAKLVRLKKEEQISKMATDLTTRKSISSKARSEAIKANPAYGIGMNVVGRLIKNATKGAVNVSKTSDNSRNESGDKKQKNDDKNQKNTDKSQNKSDAEAKARENFYKNAKEAASNKEPESESPFTNSRVSRTALPAKGSYTNEERARNSERSKSRVNSWTINSDEAKKAASKGKDVVDEIIDVTPTDVSSKRYGKQK